MHARSRSVRFHRSYDRPIGPAATVTTAFVATRPRVPVVAAVLGLLVAACGADAATPEVPATSVDATTATGLDAAEPDAAEVDAGTDTGASSGSVERLPVERLPVDITDAVLSSTAANCTAHVGTFFSDITDVTTGNDFTGSFTLASDGQTCVFSSNQIPNHDAGVGGDFANRMAEVPTLFQVTALPQPADSPSSLDMGPAVVLLNGVTWEPYQSACFGVGRADPGFERIDCGRDHLANPWRYNIGSPLNDFGLDERRAHVQPDGRYHYHAAPPVLHDPDCGGGAPSPVIGFAADGFPVHGPCFVDLDGMVRPARSSHRLREGVRQEVEGYVTPFVVGQVVGDRYDGQFVGDHEYVEGLGDLDRCNGMTVDGHYAYYLTADFPYLLGCYTGTPSLDFR